MWESIAPVIITGIVTGAIAWGGIHVELRYLRRDVDRLDRRLNSLEREVRTHYPPPAS